MADGRKLLAMHTANGVGPAGRACGECLHCVSQTRPHKSRGTVSYSVCRKLPIRLNGHGERQRQPWLRAWPTCGLFREA